MQIIAADVGGTKTRLAFSDSGELQDVFYEVRYQSGAFDDFESMLHTFLHGCGAPCERIDTLSLALPGLVGESSARLTNLPWTIEKQSLKETFGITNVYFMNDFQASAYGAGELTEQDRVVLHQGIVNSDRLQKNSNRVVVGAGTGLGVAWADEDGQSTTCTHHTEGGHIDFAPTDDTQIELLKFLQRRFGHVSYERILSGDGLVSLYQFFSGNLSEDINAEWVSQHCEDDPMADLALTLFVKIYGAYIGNIALLFKPGGGIFITGGIAAKIIERMQSDAFLNAYLDKGRMRTLVEQITVYLVTNDRVGLLGALYGAANIQHSNLKQNHILQVSE